MLIPSEPEVVYCKQMGHIGTPACRSNHICADGICEACMAAEACGDGIDNDCNGVIDDGCSRGAAGGAGAGGEGGG
jgi:hypothetical protein